MGRRSIHDRWAVARIILEAMNAQLPVVATLQEVFEVDERKAGWLLRWARRNGSLGFGEHRPVRAVILRNTPREKSWLVCQTCTTHWPCDACGYAARMPTTEGKGTSPNDEAPRA